MEKPFEHVVIAGCGLLGASLGLALRKHGLARLITGVGRSGSGSVEVARRRGAIDRATDDLAAAIAGTPAADLVVLCTPVRQFPALLREMAAKLPPGCIVTDVGSTKSQVMQWAAELLPPHVDFVGSHPMAGSEKTGPEAAREDLYHGAVCLVCPPEITASSSEDAATRIVELWQALGMRVRRCAPAQHDRWVAQVSHLPHGLAFSLMNAVGEESEAWSAAAGGFADMTRIAGSDTAMWTDIFLTNRDAVLEALGRFAGELGVLEAAIRAGDAEGIARIVTRSREARGRFIEQRRAAAAPGTFPTAAER